MQWIYVRRSCVGPIRHNPVLRTAEDSLDSSKQSTLGASTSRTITSSIVDGTRVASNLNSPVLARNSDNGKPTSNFYLLLTMNASTENHGEMQNKQDAEENAHAEPPVASASEEVDGYQNFRQPTLIRVCIDTTPNTFLRTALTNIQCVNKMDVETLRSRSACVYPRIPVPSFLDNTAHRASRRSHRLTQKNSRLPGFGSKKSLGSWMCSSGPSVRARRATRFPRLPQPLQPLRLLYPLHPRSQNFRHPILTHCSTPGKTRAAVCIRSGIYTFIFDNCDAGSCLWDRHSDTGR